MAGVLVYAAGIVLSVVAESALAFTLELLYDGDAGSHEPDEHDGGQKPFHESILRLGTSRAERGLTR